MQHTYKHKFDKNTHTHKLPSVVGFTKKKQIKITIFIFRYRFKKKQRFMLRFWC